MSVLPVAGPEREDRVTVLLGVRVKGALSAPGDRAELQPPSSRPGFGHRNASCQGAHPASRAARISETQCAHSWLQPGLGGPWGG